MNASDTVGELAAALAKASCDFGDVKKGKTANTGTYSYKYADLGDVLDAVRKPLADNGLAVVQPIGIEESGQPVLITRLMHTSGEWMESVYPLHDYAKPQEMGSALTYARRYSLSSLLGIAAEDDDGQAAQGGRDEGTKDKATRQQARPKPPAGKAPAPREVPSQPSSGKEEVTGGAVLGKDEAASPVLKAKRAHFRSLCVTKKIDADEYLKPTGQSLDDLDLDAVNALIAEVQTLGQAIDNVKEAGLL